MHRLSPEAESDLDALWYHTAIESGSVETADRLVEAIGSRFLLLQRYPHIGSSRGHEPRPGLRSLPVADYLIVYRLDDTDILILRVVRGSRDLDALLGS